jgi:glutaredoxin 2
MLARWNEESAFILLQWAKNRNPGTRLPLAYTRDALEFFTDRDPKYKVSFDKQVENTSTCIARRERDSAALMEFLAQYDDR